MPAKIAVIRDARILNRLNIQPSREYVIKKLSAPIWGVAIRNDMLAPFDAPLFFKDTATGSAPHEHKGRGIPKSVDFITEPKELLPKCLRIIVSGNITCIMAATKKPNSRYADISLKKNRVSFNISKNRFI
jgi:hypothetical protein